MSSSALGSSSLASITTISEYSSSYSSSGKGSLNPGLSDPERSLKEQICIGYKNISNY